jgi:hypothetical protein
LEEQFDENKEASSLWLDKFRKSEFKNDGLIEIGGEMFAKVA